MRLGMWNVRSLYGAGSLVTVSNNYLNISLISVNAGGQMGGRWHRTSRRIHIFYGKGNEKHELGTDCLCIREYQQLRGLRLVRLLVTYHCS
jgi:hypothetical protein